MNFAFFDPVTGYLTDHIKERLTHPEVVQLSCLMTVAHQTGQEDYPSPYFVVWDERGPEHYIGVFCLDYSELPKGTLDRIEAEAAILTDMDRRGVLH